jgi:CheY-like chemotaxis protein
MYDLCEWDVLVVDDEPDNIGVVELVLGFHNANVRAAGSGAECLQMLEQRPCNLLLVDIQMPGMSGFELLETIRQHRHWRTIPVIAVTAHAMAGDAERITAAGFDGYIAKPINAMSFVDEIMTILTSRVDT